MYAVHKWHFFKKKLLCVFVICFCFSQEELSGMKNRVQVVVLENERLQQELKSQKEEEETMREQTLLDASVSIF